MFEVDTAGLRQGILQGWRIKPWLLEHVSSCTGIAPCRSKCERQEDRGKPYEDLLVFYTHQTLR